MNYSELLSDGRLQCLICPRQCKLREGQRGFCHARQRKGDSIILPEHGQSSGFCIDPIEKKPLFHFLPGTSTLSFGTVGCNLGCRFCQNWHISKAQGSALSTERLSAKRIANRAVDLGCASVAFTYNDPVISLEWTIEVAEACRQAGLKTVAVTAGYLQGSAREAFFQVMDAANIDLKGFSEDFYRNYCAGSLQPVLDTLQYVKQMNKVWLEITTLLIPGANDSERDLHHLSQWCCDHLGAQTPLHFTAYHPAFKVLDKEPTPSSTLQKARKIALGKGLQFVYTGNIFDEKGSTTKCAACKTVLIARSGFSLLSYALDEQGRCRSCGTSCPGVFASAPGSWGSRRLRVDI